MDTQGLEGSVWRVCIPIVGGMNVDLVTPESYLAGPGNIGGQSHHTHKGIVVKGFAYNFRLAATSDEHLTLQAHESPWISEGTVVDDPIWKHDVTDAGYYQMSVDNCHIPLEPGGMRPDASPTTASGAILNLTTSDNIDAGFLMIWGIHTSNVWGRQSQTSSPAVY